MRADKSVRTMWINKKKSMPREIIYQLSRFLGLVLFPSHTTCTFRNNQFYDQCLATGDRIYSFALEIVFVLQTISPFVNSVNCLVWSGYVGLYNTFYCHLFNCLDFRMKNDGPWPWKFPEKFVPVEIFFIVFNELSHMETNFNDTHEVIAFEKKKLSIIEWAIEVKSCKLIPIDNEVKQIFLSFLCSLQCSLIAIMSL